MFDNVILYRCSKRTKEKQNMKLVRTIAKLEEQLKKDRLNASKEGKYGLSACKDSIRWEIKNQNKTIDEIYVELVNRALTDAFFNTNMIVACEQMIEESKKGE